MAVLFEEELGSGRHIVRWDGKGQDGEFLNSGVYFMRLFAEKLSASRKILLLK